MCDLARELDRLGHHVAFYSFVPPWRTRPLGLRDECNRWLGPWVAPFYVAERVARHPRLQRLAAELVVDVLDRVAARSLERCDVFIGMSGIGPRVAEIARRKFGARVFVERGSRHVLSQKAILEALPRPPGSGPPVGERTVRRELHDYQSADLICVPSSQVVQSFVDEGVSRDKLFCNPYGVDLEMFPPTLAPASRRTRTIVMAGVWCYRKGCDVLVDAWRRLPGTRLLHVGAVGDAPLPTDARFEHLDAVDQRKLSAIYAQADVFALASREEGLALVQAQAVASGLPLVCTERTGGADLRALLDDPSLVEVVPPDDASAFAAALGRALERAGNTHGLREPLGAGRERPSWRAYGERYHRKLLEQV